MSEPEYPECPTCGRELTSDEIEDGCLACDGKACVICGETGILLRGEDTRCLDCIDWEVGLSLEVTHV